MGEQTLKYRLPLSAVRVSGTVKHTHDTILEKDSAEPAVGVELMTIGNPAAEVALTYMPGGLVDTTMGLERLEDGRLASTSSESTGQGTKVVTAATGLIATGIGLAVAGVPGAALAATATAAVGRRGATAAAVDPDETKVAEEYRKKHGAFADARVALAERLAALRSTVADLAAEVATATSPEARQAKARELKAAEAAIGIVRSQLDAVDRHFAIWRATTITSRVEDFDRLITLDEFAAVGQAEIDERGDLVFHDGEAKDAASAARDKLCALWKDFNLFLEFVDDPAVAEESPFVNPSKNAISYREPRWALLRVSERSGNKAVTKSEKRYAILDNRCTHRTFELRSSWFSRKSSKISFSSAGVATGFASGSTSSVAAFAESVGGIPGTVSAGLKSAIEITDSVYALRSKALDNELARVKKEVDLRQQRVISAGLDVTEAQSAELDGLQQRQAILEANKAILEAGNSIEELQAPQAPPTELARLRDEVALLRTQFEKAVLEGALARGAQDSPDVADVLRYVTTGTNQTR